MGEIADYYIGLMQGFGRNPQGFSYRPRLRPVCKTCQSKSVFWSQIKGGHWRLHDTADRKLHVCPTSADGFEDEDV